MLAVAGERVSLKAKALDRSSGLVNFRSQFGCPINTQHSPINRLAYTIEHTFPFFDQRYQVQMIKILIPILLILLLIEVDAQKNPSVYIHKGSENTPTGWCYQVTEFCINSDSTFAVKSYGCGNPRDKKNYKKWKCEQDSGTVSKQDDFFYLNYDHGEFHKAQIDSRKLIILYPNMESKLEKIREYKRVKN